MGCGCGGNKNRRSRTVSRLPRQQRLRSTNNRKRKATRGQALTNKTPTTRKESEEKERVQRLRQIAIRRALGHG